MNWGRAESKARGYLKGVDVDDLYDQLDSLRGYLKDLTGTASKRANKQIDRGMNYAGDLTDQLDGVRGYLQDLTGSFSKRANKQIDRGWSYASDTAGDAEDLMKDNLAASLVLAAGFGVVIGYFLRRGTE